MTRELRTIIFILGILLIFNSAIMIIPIIVSLWVESGEAARFFYIACFGFGLGGLLVISNYERQHYLAVRGTYVLIPLAYIVSAIYSGLPYIIGPPFLSFNDAYFEAISGFSTTGATVITSLDQLPAGILIWRSVTQWIGGIGVLFLAVLIIPLLNIGGQQLLRIDRSEGLQKSLPRAIAFFINTMAMYLVLTVACVFMYRLFGMTMFDAWSHALTTVSTGGFSTHDASFGYFAFNGIEYVSVVFMLVCSFPLPALVLIFNNRWDVLFRDEQIRYLMIIVGSGIAVMVIWSALFTSYMDTSFSHLIFNIISIITGTGYISQDYTVWGPFATIFFLLAMCLGGCSSSTTGGIKTFRVVIFFRQVTNMLRLTLNSRRISAPHFNGRRLEPSMVSLVMVFILTYIVVWLLLFFLLLLYDLDALTAFSAAASAIGNVGPGLGNVVGPSGTYASLPDGAKWLMSIGMLMGRVELFPVIILFWRGLWTS